MSIHLDACICPWCTIVKLPRTALRAERLNSRSPAGLREDERDAEQVSQAKLTHRLHVSEDTGRPEAVCCCHASCSRIPVDTMADGYPRMSGRIERVFAFTHLNVCTCNGTSCFPTVMRVAVSRGKCQSRGRPRLRELLQTVVSGRIGTRHAAPQSAADMFFDVCGRPGGGCTAHGLCSRLGLGGMGAVPFSVSPTAHTQSFSFIFSLFGLFFVSACVVNASGEA